MSSTFKALVFLAFLLTSMNSAAVTRIINSTSNDANTIGTLPYWLLNANDGDVLDCSSIAGLTITLSASLPAITKSYTINGLGVTIDGAGSYQAFQVASGTSVIKNVTVKNTLSKGGNGGNGYSGGGGAVGGGGALYVHGGTTVTLEASSLSNNVARDGDGGSANNIGNAGGGGGGGFGGGDGGSALSFVSTGGGGGGHSNGGSGGSQTSKDGGSFNAGGGNGASDPSSVGGGGGGSGLGGAIFIQSNATLTIVNAQQIANNSAIAGIGGSSTNDTDPGYIPAGDGLAL